MKANRVNVKVIGDDGTNEESSKYNDKRDQIEDEGNIDEDGVGDDADDGDDDGNGGIDEETTEKCKVFVTKKGVIKMLENMQTKQELLQNPYKKLKLSRSNT